METVEQYDTLVQGINALREQGYVEDFNLKATQLAVLDFKALANFGKRRIVSVRLVGSIDLLAC